MKAIIEDTWFPAGTKIRINDGADELLFRRCSFDGGEIFIADEIKRMIFSRCVFRGTRFSGQSLTERIATACRSVSPATEETASEGTPRQGKFRS